MNSTLIIMVSPEIRQLVFSRAAYRCEYCHSPLSHSCQPFDVEHIIPLSKNGSNELHNLACACGGCNGHKFTKTHGFDTVSEQVVPRYHPRSMKWRYHFTWSDDFTELIGISPTGRITMETLHLNRTGNINMRQLLLLVGLHPPKI